MSVQQYGAAAMELAKDEIKKWIKSKLKIVAIIIVVIASILIPFFIAIAGNSDELGKSSSGMYSASSSSWEQFLEYVASKEGGTKTEDGLYYIVENDWAGNPTVGHGLCLKSSDGYLHADEFNAYNTNSKQLADNWLNGDRNGKISVEICDAIWESHLKAKYDSIVSKYPNLTTYQHYALTDVVYRRGNTNGFQEKYNSKWKASDDQYGNYEETNELFSTDTLFDFFWNGGHELDGVRTRKKDQWVLFKYGYYRPLNEYYRATTITANIDSLDPNDYGGVYTSSKGYTFIQYYQNKSSWSNDSLNGYSGCNLGGYGCNVTSNAIVLSGLTGETITPRQVNNAFSFASNDASNLLKTSAFSKYDNLIEITGYYYNPTVSGLITNLQAGNVAILKFNAKIGYVNNWAVTTHFVACVDYKNENGTDYIYIINPNRSAKNATGWYATSSINVTGWQNMRFYCKK